MTKKMSGDPDLGKTFSWKNTSMEGQESLQVTWNIDNYWLLLEVQRAVCQLYSGREQVQRYITTM
jgi:hypothetical protein